MSKFIIICNTLGSNRQLLDLVKLNFTNRKISFIYSELNNWDKKFTTDHNWNYIPLIDISNNLDFIISQNLKGNYISYFNDIKCNTFFWITDNKTYNRYKFKIKDWIPLFACLEGGNQHFYYTNQNVFYKKEEIFPLINREENYKILLNDNFR